MTGRAYHLHQNAPPTPCPCGYTFTWTPPKGLTERERRERRRREGMEFLAELILPLLLNQAAYLAAGPRRAT